MTDFRKTNWARPEFSRSYRDNADIFIVDRNKMLAILQSFYAHFIKNGSRRKILDLGCGDGIVASAIAEIDQEVFITLADGSVEMLEKARKRLNGYRRPRCLRLSFQEMIRSGAVRGTFHFIASSLAIHHLTMKEKMGLFRKIYELLDQGGHFLNIDVVLAPRPELENWYLSLWKDWIDERRWDLCIGDDRLRDITRKYKEADENKPDTLMDQMDALQKIGFLDVDCYYKNGIFTMFGGRKK